MTERQQWCAEQLYDILAELRKREARTFDVSRKTQIQQQIVRLVGQMEQAGIIKGGF